MLLKIVSVVLLIVIMVAAIAVFASTATLDVDGGTIQVFEYDVEIEMPPIPD